MVGFPATTNFRDAEAAGAAGFTRSQALALGAFIAGSVMLALAMRQSPALATVHAMGCTGVAIIYAITTRHIRNIAYVIAYLAGSEVLWRMCRAGVFYEIGKYSILAICAIGIVRVRGNRNRGLALLYLALLVPSAAFTFVSLDLDTARQEVAFTLSGPAAIALAIAFFSNIRLSFEQLWRVFACFIAPVAGIAAITVATTRASELDFGNGSNVATSGGFGPNQVSAILGLATLFFLLPSLERRLRWDLRAFALGIASVFAALSALTFSRGGIVLALVGAAAAVFVLVRGTARGRMTVALVTLATLAVGKYVVEPRLESITNGKLGERYSNTQTSGRDIYATSELQFFEEHPVMGIGPGIGTHQRQENGMLGAASHTEYTRMLGEHGLLGVLALGCLILLWSRAIRHQSAGMSRAYSCAFVAWTAFFLLIYSTRLAAPALVIGLAFVRRPSLPQREGLVLVAPDA